VAALGYGGSLLVAAGLLLRRARPVDLAPVAALAGTQALWFSIPVLLRHLGMQPGLEPWASDGAYYFLWIALAHAVQYLWVTSYHAGVSGPWSGMSRYLAKALAAGALAWTLPALLFAPGLLGRVPYGAGLALLVAAVVNLQHFVLDGAIWKLRDGRVARVLLRPRDPAALPLAGPPRWTGRLVWAAAAVCVAIMLVTAWERHIGVERAAGRGDLERIARGVERLRWLGRDLPEVRVALARAHLGRGNTLGALHQLNQVLALQPTGDAWFVLANVYKQQHRWDLAVEAYQKAVELQPGSALAHYELGLAWMQLDQPGRAQEAFERAVALEPSRGIYAVLRDRAQAASAAGP
jgi:tetratricopeptide (TPR) repeat protein